MPQEMQAALESILGMEDINQIKQVVQALLEAGAGPAPEEAAPTQELDQGMDKVLTQ